MIEVKMRVYLDTHICQVVHSLLARSHAIDPSGTCKVLKRCRTMTDIAE